MFKSFRITKRGIVALSLTVILSGCGTVTAMKDDGVVSMGEWDTKPAKAIIYPGLMTDVTLVLQHGEVYRMLDFPFSFIADTLILPYTVTARLNDKPDNKQ